MKKICIIFSILCFIISRKIKTKLKHTKKDCATYAEGAVTDRMCQKWFVKFHAGHFSLDDAPQLGRPVEAESNQIKTLIDNNQCYNAWEMANTLKISRSIKLLVRMKTVSFILWKKTYGHFG